MMMTTEQVDVADLCARLRSFQGYMQEADPPLGGDAVVQHAAHTHGASAHFHFQALVVIIVIFFYFFHLHSLFTRQEFQICRSVFKGSA